MEEVRGVGGGWKRKLRVDLREWRDVQTDKKCISLTLIRWMNWLDYLEYAIKQGQRNKTIRVISKRTFIVPSLLDIRHYRMPQEEVVPHKRGYG